MRRRRRQGRSTRRSGMARAGSGAFTLVELLVVIGIVALLLAILLPTVAGARRQARLVQCGSNLRQLVQACQMHAQHHGGFLPLAGHLVADPRCGFDGLPYGLNDGRRKRYTYVPSVDWGPEVVSVVTLPAALAPYLGVSLPQTNWHDMDQTLNDHQGVWRRFMCPDSNAYEKAKLRDDPNDRNHVDQGTMLLALPLGMTWSTNSDYALNEGVFGFHYEQRFGGNRLAGNLARIRRASEVALFTDGVARKAPAVPGMPGWITWTPTLDGTGPATLGDAFGSTGRVDSGESFDRHRHARRTNVAFADGHVETVALTREALDKVYLIAP